MARKKSPPHLAADHQGVQRCCICKMPFPPDVKPTLDEAFTDHVRKAHRPGQTTEDISQAAFRVVREATKE